jgi:malonate transporter
MDALPRHRMAVLFLLLPDFALIVLGHLLRRHAGWGDAFWSGLEKLVYFILFPALLFHTTARTPFAFASTGNLLIAALGAVAGAIACGWLARPLFRTRPMIFESGVQTAFRFNSYLALAVASRLGGDAGTSLMALLIGFAVPLCNMAAVHALAHRTGGVLRELARNPLLLATAGGVLFNLAGLHLPDVAAATLARLGAASLALGLLAVGAGLRLSGAQDAKGIAAWFVAVKLVVMPALAFALGRWLQLPPLQFKVVVLFAALPTASSAYVLAARMGGNGPFVAFLISVGTLISAVSLPIWLLFAG